MSTCKWWKYQYLCTIVPTCFLLVCLSLSLKYIYNGLYLCVSYIKSILSRRYYYNTVPSSDYTNPHFNLYPLCSDQIYTIKCPMPCSSTTCWTYMYLHTNLYCCSACRSAVQLKG